MTRKELVAALSRLLKNNDIRKSDSDVRRDEINFRKWMSKYGYDRCCDEEIMYTIWGLSMKRINNIMLTREKQNAHVLWENYYYIHYNGALIGSICFVPDDGWFVTFWTESQTEKFEKAKFHSLQRAKTFASSEADDVYSFFYKNGDKRC